MTYSPIQDSPCSFVHPIQTWTRWSPVYLRDSSEILISFWSLAIQRGWALEIPLMCNCKQFPLLPFPPSRPWLFSQAIVLRDFPLQDLESIHDHMQPSQKEFWSRHKTVWNCTCSRKQLSSSEVSFIYICRDFLHRYVLFSVLDQNSNRIHFHSCKKWIWLPIIQ